MRREEERVQKWAVSKIVRRREENGFEKQSETLGFLDFMVWKINVEHDEDEYICVY